MGTYLNCGGCVPKYEVIASANIFRSFKVKVGPFMLSKSYFPRIVEFNFVGSVSWLSPDKYRFDGNKLVDVILLFNGGSLNSLLLVTMPLQLLVPQEGFVDIIKLLFRSFWCKSLSFWPLMAYSWTVEVERAGNFNSSSWAEPEIFSIWWAELSRAGRELQNDELSWAELARAKWAEKWAEKQLKIRNLVSQTSSYLYENTKQFWTGKMCILG